MEKIHLTNSQLSVDKVNKLPEGIFERQPFQLMDGVHVKGGSTKVQTTSKLTQPEKDMYLTTQVSFQTKRILGKSHRAWCFGQFSGYLFQLLITFGTCTVSMVHVC